MFRISGHFDGNTILCSNHSKEQPAHGVGELFNLPAKSIQGHALD